MKAFMRRVDRFCYTHPRFGIPNLILYLVIGSGLVWLIGMMDRQGTLAGLLVFSAEKIFTQGQVWRLITFVLVPDDGGIFTLIALYFYYFIGTILEQQWGTAKFTIYYLCGMVFSILYGVLVWLISGYDPMVSATYLNLSMFLAFATLFPDNIVLVFFIIPVKIKWLAYIAAAGIALSMLLLPWQLKLLPLVAILNYLLFFGNWLTARFRPEKLQQQKKTVDFKNAARQYARQQANKPYQRKCEVCGITDRDDPEMEFRFCSRCAGYHCFCSNHINSHVHFKE